MRGLLLRLSSFASFARARDLALRLAVVLTWLALQASVRADIPAEWLGADVVAVHVLGVGADQIDADALGIPLGAPLDRGLVRAAIERLAREGRWADVQVDAQAGDDGITLLFHLVPRLVVQRVDLVGNQAIDDTELAGIVGMREESELDQGRFPSLIEQLLAAYELHGYYAANVRVLLRDTDDPGRKVVRIEIAEGPPTRIARVRFVGDALPRRRGVRRLLGMGVHDPADLPRIERGLERTERLLRQNGYYGAELGTPKLVRRGTRAQLEIPSSIGPRFELRFAGNGQISRSTLFAALMLDQERFTGDASLRSLEQKLVELYRRYGYRDARVGATSRTETRVLRDEHGVEQLREQVLVIDVRIDSGEQLVVDVVTFPGASHYEIDFLREQVFSYLEQALPGSSLRAPVDSDVADRLGFGGGVSRSERSAPKPLLLDPRRLFHAPSYARAVEHIRELYRGDGFLDVEVAEVRLVPLKQPQHVVAEIVIHEGPRTFVHDVHLEGNRALSSRALLTTAGLLRDAPFSYLKVEEARLRMVAAYQEEGYFFASIEPRVRRSDDGTRAEITLRVSEGYLVRVGAIEVRGAGRAKESMVRDRLRLKVGDLYRPSRARESQDALLALDVFSSVIVGPAEPDLPARTKTVVVDLTERKTQWLGWSGGFSTGEGVRGGLEYGYRNLFGSALHASFRGQLGYQLVFLDKEIERRYRSLPSDQRTEYQATLSFGVPYVPRLPKITMGLDLSVLADIQRDFRMQKESGVASLLYRPVRRWTLALAEELEFSDFKLFEQDLDNIGNLTVNDLVPEGENTLLSTQLTVAWDRRDRAFNARRGFLISFTSEWARTLSGETARVQEAMQATTTVKTFKSNMLRFTGSFAFYVPLGPKLTFASQTRYGRIVHLEDGSQSYPNRRFYLGGTNFRGFQQNQMVPQDLQDNPDVRTRGIVSRGADTFVVTQNELRFPLIGELYGGVFADVGNLWADPTKVDLRKLEPVVGLGLRLQTPVASLAFDYGVRALHTDPFGLAGAFQFAFQTF